MTRGTLERRLHDGHFWRRVALGVAGLLVISAYIGHAWRVGYSNEALQSVGAAWFLVHLGVPPRLDRYAVFHVGPGLWHFHAGTLFVKKVVGLPGDLVRVGALETTVNGHRVAGSLDSLSVLRLRAQHVIRTFIVPRGHYFVVGTRPYSYDSRYWGTVPTGAIVGKAYLL